MPTYLSDRCGRGGSEQGGENGGETENELHVVVENGGESWRVLLLFHAHTRPAFIRFHRAAYGVSLDLGIVSFRQASRRVVGGLRHRERPKIPQERYGEK